MPFPACKVFAFALALLGLCITAAPGPALADRAAEAKVYYDDLGWEHKEFSPGFTELRRAWLREPSERTQATLAELALAGDLDALAFLAVLDRAASGSVRVIPPSFWTDLTLELLGPGEGNYYLAMHYLLHMQAKNAPEIHWYIARARNAEHFFQSALARHPEGQLGAAITASARDYYRKFSELPLPAGATDTDRKALELPSGWDPEAQFWLVSASVAGCSEASLQLGGLYLWDREEKYHNTAMADFYFTRCAHDGNNLCASTIFYHSKGGGGLKEDYPRSFTYLVLHARLLEGGLYVTNDKEKYRVGYSVYKWGQSYLNGDEEENIPPGSMTQADYDEGVRLSKIYYDEWKAKDDAKKAAREALYEQARKQLPEKRAAWEEYKKKK